MKGAKYMVTEDDLTLGGGHTVPCIDHVSWKSIRETYIMLTNEFNLNKMKRNVRDSWRITSQQVLPLTGYD